MGAEHEWVYVGQEGGPPLENGHLVPNDPLRLRRLGPGEDGVERVEVAGSVEFGPVFTLPEGFRPTAETVIMTLLTTDGGIWCRYVVAAKREEESLGPKTPDWAGPAPIIEPTTFAQGSFGHRCRLCGADDYAGPLQHRPGCPGAEA